MKLRQGFQASCNVVKLYKVAFVLFAIVSFLYAPLLSAEIFSYDYALQVKNSGDHAKAEQIFLALIEDDDDNGELWFQLGLVQRYQKKIEAAMASQKKAIELSPNNYDIKLEMARLYIGEQSFKQADLLLTEILEAHPDYVIAQKLSLQIKRSKLGLPNSSKIDPVAYKNALEAKKEGDYVKSEELFLQLIEKTEDSPKAWFQLGLVQKHLGKIEESLTSMSKALELAPKRNDIRFEIAKTHIDNKDLDLAEQSIDEALKKSPEDKEAKKLLLSIQKERYPSYFQALKLKKDGDYKGAEEILLQLCEEYKDESKMWFQLGLAQRFQDKLDIAIASQSKALELSPDNDEIKLELARLHTWNHDFVQAEQLVDKVLKNNPKHTDEGLKKTLDNKVVKKQHPIAQKEKPLSENKEIKKQHPIAQKEKAPLEVKEVKKIQVDLQKENPIEDVKETKKPQEIAQKEKSLLEHEEIPPPELAIQKEKSIASHKEAKKVQIDIQKEKSSLYLQALEAKKLGNYKEAEKDLSLLTEKYTDETKMWFQLGLVQRFQKNIDAAIVSQSKALELSPDDGDVKLEMARLYMWNRNFVEAEKLVNEVIKEHPDYLEAQDLASTIQRTKFSSLDSEFYRWQVVTVFERSNFSRKEQPDWRTGFFQLGYWTSPDTLIHARMENAERMNAYNEYYELGIMHIFNDNLVGHFNAGHTPEAVFMPDWRFKAGVEIRPFHDYKSYNKMWFTSDLKYDLYNQYDIITLKLGIRFFITDMFSVHLQDINIFDENGKHLNGWSSRMDWQTPLDELRVFGGISNAPETEGLTTVSTEAVFVGTAYQITPQTAVNISYSQEDRDNSFIRHVMSAALLVRF
jgi:YaiO family outer membrane protein